MKIKKRVIDFYENFVDEYESNRFGSLKDYVINIIQLKVIHKIVRSKRARISLDAGCGTGRISRILSQDSRMTIGFDASIKMLNRARTDMDSSHCVEFIRGDIEHLPFRDDSFDVVACFRVIYHMDNPKKSLAELTRVTKPNGLLLIDLMNKYSLFNFYCSVFKVKPELRTKFFDLQKIADLLVSSGMNIIEMIGVRSPLIQLFPSKIPRSHQKLVKLIYILEKLQKPNFLHMFCTQMMIYAKKVK